MADMETGRDDRQERLAFFTEDRNRLLRLAYRYLENVADAEDVVQEAWLRYDMAAQPDNPSAFLATVVTRLCLDRLKSASRRRETYVGPWLPEPLLGEAGITDPDGSEAALDVSYAVMSALERLSPLERAAFFLHDLFDMPFEDVGGVIGRSPAAARKLASRARRTLREGNRRFAPDKAALDRFVAAFSSAVESGNPAELGRILAEDVTLVTDGGGKAIAARNVIRGRDAVSRFLVGVATKRDAAQTGYRFELINGNIGIVISTGGAVDQTFAFDLDETGDIAAFHIVRNPDKLRRLHA